MFKLKTMYRKGQVGLDVAKAFMLGILTLGVIAFAIIIAINSLNSSTVSTNATTGILNNISSGTSSFFANAGTWFSLLAVVIILLIIAIVLIAVNKFSGGNSQGM